MLLWVVDGVLIVAGWLAARRMYHRVQDYPATFFGRVRRGEDLRSPHRFS